MDAVTTPQVHALLSRTDTPAGHSTRPQGRATTTAFSSYAFGPLQSGGVKGGSAVKPVTGNYGQAQPSAVGSQAWIAQVQASAGVKSHQ